MMNEKIPEWNPGSFRDPGSRVYQTEETVYRTLSPDAARAFEVVRNTGVLDRLMKKKWLVQTATVDGRVLGEGGQHAALVLQHEKIPFVSYPYEWSFAQLHAAALLHLKLHIALLERNVTLSDSTAYNIQFIGAKPLFIDVTSLRPYQEGEYWHGHRQFCEQFLNPLLLHAVVGVAHHAWFRGHLEGVPLSEFAMLAPWRARLNWRFFLHVVLQNRLQTRAEQKQSATAVRLQGRGLQRTALVALLSQLQRYIEKLVPRQGKTSTWERYAHQNTYETGEAEAKQNFVAQFMARVRPRLLLDLGCNSGDYAVVALQNGASLVVGFDADQQVLNRAFERAQSERLAFLPLYQDLANPSPEQGWNQLERQGFLRRARGDAILALAFIHHLAIARNIPLDQVVATLVSMAPRGVVEFVPKTDPTVKTMLALREDIFPEYTQETFTKLLGQHASIVETKTISSSGRTLYVYEVPPRC